MLTLAFISEMLASAFGRDWLETGTLKVRFKGAAYIGDQVETWGQIIKEELVPPHHRLTCAVGVRNRQSGQEIISGTAMVKIGAFHR